MRQQFPSSEATSDHGPKRDLELCKVVFSAAISQILYARRAFPPECFQLLPLGEVVSRSFEDIVASGSDIKVHDKELLRNQENTLFLRQGKGYGINRFLGILREDIFPIVETEALIKFRINYLRTMAWKNDCLIEYYTMALKYEQGGSYELDIWRAGTGKQHIATTDCHLWNLGDYLSRLPSSTEPLYWTLAFHATERPDDPPIGIWKFDRTDFDDANFDLQQRDEYTYARIVRLEILPLSPSDIDDVISETSQDPDPEVSMPQRSSLKLLRAVGNRQTQRKQKSGQRPSSKNSGGNLGSQHRVAAATQLSPPRTLPSSRNTSTNATVNTFSEVNVAVDNIGSGLSKNTGEIRHPSPRKGVVMKRKPKRPLQLFETAASSLPSTQIIGESQSLSQKSLIQKSGQSRELITGSRGHVMFNNDMPQSSSPDPFKWFDGISLSPEAITATQSSPYLALPRLPPQLLNTQPHAREAAVSGECRDLLRLRPSSSVSGAPPGLSQWEPQASPIPNLFGITISEDEDHNEAVSEPKQEVLFSTPIKRGDDKGMSLSFSPHTVARRTSLFHGIPSSNSGEE